MKTMPPKHVNIKSPKGSPGGKPIVKGGPVRSPS